MERNPDGSITGIPGLVPGTKDNWEAQAKHHQCFAVLELAPTGLIRGPGNTRIQNLNGAIILLLKRKTPVRSESMLHALQCSVVSVHTKR